VITSREPDRADLAQLAGYIRGHCGIENRLHNGRDGRRAFDEDHQTVRGPAAQVMAILRNVAISCLVWPAATRSPPRCVVLPALRCGRSP